MCLFEKGFIFFFTTKYVNAGKIAEINPRHVFPLGGLGAECGSCSQIKQGLLLY